MHGSVSAAVCRRSLPPARAPESRSAGRAARHGCAVASLARCCLKRGGSIPAGGAQPPGRPAWLRRGAVQARAVGWCVVPGLQDAFGLDVGDRQALARGQLGVAGEVPAQGLLELLRARVLTLDPVRLVRVHRPQQAARLRGDGLAGEARGAGARLPAPSGRQPFHHELQRSVRRTRGPGPSLRSPTQATGLVLSDSPARSR